MISIVLLLPLFNNLYSMHCIYNVVVVVVEINFNSIHLQKSTADTQGCCSTHGIHITQKAPRYSSAYMETKWVVVSNRSEFKSNTHLYNWQSGVLNTERAQSQSGVLSTGRAQSQSDVLNTGRAQSQPGVLNTGRAQSKHSPGNEDADNYAERRLDDTLVPRLVGGVGQHDAVTRPSAARTLADSIPPDVWFRGYR